MPWIGYDEKYLDRPFTGAAVWGCVGRPLAIEDTADDFLFRNAEGYDASGTLPKTNMKKTPLSEPLPPSILNAIREEAKRRKKGG
jgi:hypothetical protein